MTESTPLDIAPAMLTRIRRVAKARGWSQPTALAYMLERGLTACESELAASFDDSDAQALQAAIAAMQQVPDDTGFAKIGQVESAIAR